MPFCVHCGCENKDQFKFCMNCGAQSHSSGQGNNTIEKPLAEYKMPMYAEKNRAKYKSKYGVNDLVLLQECTEDSIVLCLRNHFYGNEIYTYIGNVLISVNPFRPIQGMYTSNTLEKFMHKNEHQNDPHVYAVAERTYRKMIRDLSKECVIISGESGAGKTEASKKIMEYIAAVSSEAVSVKKVKEQLLETNPLLESFGNAKTVVNNNSSRFGKYMQLEFDVADPVGGYISVYLLEKNRVVDCQAGERNFHVFYQLINGINNEEKAGMGLGTVENYTYLNQSGCYIVEGIDDVRWYKETVNALNIIGLTKSEQKQVFSLLAGILHLGNVKFEGTADSSRVIEEGPSSSYIWAAYNLNLDAKLLAKNLTSKMTKAGMSEIVTAHLGIKQAAYARDSLSKGIYSRLFQWLVDKANTTIYSKHYSNIIGVLDIYGFEIFGLNGFEQLCINYVNETLHQLFIDMTLVSEQKEYIDEGIEWTEISYYNNLPICQLIDAKTQLFDLLNEESILPQRTDTTFLEKVQNGILQHRLPSNYIAVSKNKSFTIKHYAGDVTYSVNGFLSKNQDLIFKNLIVMCGTDSDSKVLRDIFAEDIRIMNAKRPDTSCVQFKRQVKNLIDTLKQSNQHYIRCIKPNDDKKPNVFENDIVKKQVQYLGLLENVKVRRAGYASRMKFSTFMSKYKVISKVHKPPGSSTRDNCAALMNQLSLKDFVLGHNKIFIRTPDTLFKLEDERSIFFQSVADKIDKDDTLIFADRVTSYDENQQPVEALFVIGANKCYLFTRNGKNILFVLNTKMLMGITLGVYKEDCLVLHCKEELKTKETTKHKNNHHNHSNNNDNDDKNEIYWNVLIENVYKEAMLNVRDILCSSGIDIALRESDDFDKTDSRFVPMGGTKVTNPKGRCVIS